MKTFNLTQEALYVEHLRQEWLAEREALAKTIEQCHLSHTTPAPNYWEKAHRAEKRFLLALNVLVVLEGQA